ncbi:MAG TPA: hypothetical protein PK452_03645 [Amaricoccus sp.]|uniref:hypothetical protein n=1 Tax=Amaricoccus sp. TaxID=1872485 RepID=UPI002D1A67DC|nr:hypothetical protein [Amaricoccus sp.]HRO10601.1 hypothetical protein [Amaricoccus sp.]
MKEVRISLSEERFAEIEAEVSSGQFASVSELIEWAVATYLDPLGLPSDAEMVAEHDAMRREIEAGADLLDPEEVRQMIRDSLEE